MKIEIRARQTRTKGDLQYRTKESVIIHSGKTDKETAALWDFIEEALSKDITIICRDEGYYVISREATGSIPHSIYECQTEDENESNMIVRMLKKHLGNELL